MTIRYKALLKLNKINIVVANEKHFEERQKYTCNMYEKKRPKPNGKMQRMNVISEVQKKGHNNPHSHSNVYTKYMQNI